MRPASMVLKAISEGKTNAIDIAAATGLRESMVRALLEHFKRDGTLAAEETGCSTDGHCSSCAVANSCGTKQLLTLRVCS
ncbi:FeoC-like transcriptional regulator [Corynebacterium vitaeruminis]|uniref:Transcriptional regulator HTH-type FeoC domain-containing protein n=1 Tax=Corynebacterium vitaeruminis DSM 20294 TaxID=1224164 RepID=W5Y6M2_9CORY|nr:FeoC-like transcriptional regulator [Corynebacterium vitaeruminis]AHI22173.1 hypothetical protein B843_03920 [Corynebacterium vitaeruminis DSM 20294]